MKKLFLICTLLITATLFTKQSDAQIIRTVNTVNYAGTAKTTVTNTDTAFAILSVDNTTVGIEGLATKVSGTVAGTIELLGSVDNTNWDVITSYTLIDQTTNYKVFSPHNSAGKLQYGYYKLRFKTSGTCSITVKGYDVRRG